MNNAAMQLDLSFASLVRNLETERQDTASRTLHQGSKCYYRAAHVDMRQMGESQRRKSCEPIEAGGYPSSFETAEAHQLLYIQSIVSACFT